MLIIHHNDNDGRCAAAVAYRYYADDMNRADIRFCEMDYKDTLDLNLFNPGELVVILDFSFVPEIMKNIHEKAGNVIWIDHHATAKDYDYGVHLEGLREFEEKKFSGCELAWMYYFPREKMPEAVQLIGNRDCWRWTPSYAARTKLFNAGMQLLDQTPDDDNWKHLFESKSLVNDIVGEGRTIEDYRSQYYRNYAKSYGYEVYFAGHKCWALNLYRCGSEAFAGYLKEPEPVDPTMGRQPSGDYDIGISYVHSKGKWTVSIYTKLDNIDLGEIAQRNGGGGHKNAAGFVVDELPWEKKGE